MKNTGLEKAAILLMTLSKENAAEVFKLLDDEEIKDLSQCMSNLGNIATENLEAVIMEFSNEMTTSLNFIGNVQNTERMLRDILGKEKVDTILEDIRGPAGRSIWDKLGNVSEEVLANYLKNEYPQTIALILSKLSSIQAAKVLSIFNSELAFEVIKRMLSMDSVKKEVLEKVEKALKTEFIASLTKTQKYDNNQIIAEIFNSFDRSNEAKFMQMLEAFSMDAADGIKKLMFTFSDLMKVSNSGIQSILKSVDKTKLPIALKGASEELRNKFTASMSERAAKILLEGIEAIGPIRIKDVDESQTAIVLVAKDLIAKGEIDISSNDESDQIVY